MRVMPRRVRRAAPAAAAAVLGLFLVAPASAAGPVAFVGQESLAVVARDGTGAASVVVSNEGPEATVAWSVMLAGAPGTARVDVEPASSSLPANGISVIDLTFRVTGTEGPLTGYLVGTVGEASFPAVLPLTIRMFPFEVPLGPGGVVIFVVGLAAALALARWVVWRWADRKGPAQTGAGQRAGQGTRQGEGQRLGPPRSLTWEPTSWATTITGAGGLLTLLTLSGALPADTIVFSREEFAALALVFAAFGVLAPLAYAALRCECWPAQMVTVAMAITTAGVLGQLATLELLVADAFGQSGGTPSLWILLLIALGCGALVLIYVWRSMTETIKTTPEWSAGRTTLPLL